MVKNNSTYFPSSKWLKNAHVNSIDKYNEIYEESIKDHDQFWTSVAERIDWYKSWDKVSDVDYKEAKISWYLNGKLKQECSFKDDRYHGLYQSWYENGNLRVQGNYLKGQQDGEWILYDKGGGRMPSIYYENGIEVTRKLKGVRR